MTEPLPDLDVTDLDRWISERLGGDDDTDPAWRSNIAPQRAKAVAQANPVRYLQVVVTPEFARILYDVAKQRGLSRESFVRVVLADAIERCTGMDRDDVLVGMPPRRRNMAAYGATA